MQHAYKFRDPRVALWELTRNPQSWDAVLLGLRRSSCALSREVARLLPESLRYAREVLQAERPVQEAVAVVQDEVDVSLWPRTVTALEDLLLLDKKEFPEISSVFRGPMETNCRPAQMFFDKISGFHTRPLLKGRFLKEELEDPEIFYREISDLAPLFFDEYLAVEEKKRGRSEILRDKGNYFFAVAERLNRIAEISDLLLLKAALETREAKGTGEELEISDLPFVFPARDAVCQAFGLESAQREALPVYTEISAHPVHLWAQQALGKTGDVTLPNFAELTGHFRILPNRKFQSLLAVAPDLRFLPTRELVRKLRNFYKHRRVAVIGPWAQGFANQLGWSEISFGDRKSFLETLATVDPEVVVVTGLPKNKDSVTDLIRACPGISEYMILGPKAETGSPEATWGIRPWWAARKRTLPLFSPTNGFRLEEISDLGGEVLCPEDTDYFRFGGAWVWRRNRSATALETGSSHIDFIED